MACKIISTWVHPPPKKNYNYYPFRRFNFRVVYFRPSPQYLSSDTSISLPSLFADRGVCFVDCLRTLCYKHRNVESHFEEIPEQQPLRILVYTSPTPLFSSYEYMNSKSLALSFPWDYSSTPPRGFDDAGSFPRSGLRREAAVRATCLCDLMCDLTYIAVID